MGYRASLLLGAAIINAGSTNRAPIPVVLGMRAADPLHRGTVLSPPHFRGQLSASPYFRPVPARQPIVICVVRMLSVWHRALHPTMNQSTVTVINTVASCSG